MMTNLLLRTGMLCTCVAVFIAAPTSGDTQETTFARDGNGFVETIEQQYEVDPEGTLTLDADTGSILVDSWMIGEVAVLVEKRTKGRREDRARGAFEEIEVVLSQRDGDVHIRVVDNDESIFFRDRVTVEITVRVPEHYTLDLSTVDGSIEIEDMKGPVTAFAVDGDIEIGTVEGWIDAGTTDGSIEIDEVNGDITARAADGDIEIDSTRGHVTASTTDGNIEVRSTQGPVTANSVDGDIEVRQAAGEVSARTTDGNVEIHNARSAVDVHAVDGSIETWNTRGSIDASTLEGDIGLFDALGSVNAKAVRGDIYVEVARADKGRNEDGDSDSQGTGEQSLTLGSRPLEPGPLGSRPLEPETVTHRKLETLEGDVTIYLPDDLEASIEAEGSSGGLVLSRLWREEVGHIFSDFRLNQSEWGVFFYVKSEASGHINGGGDRIRLKTNSGNIFIKER